MGTNPVGYTYADGRCRHRSIGNSYVDLSRSSRQHRITVGIASYADNDPTAVDIYSSPSSRKHWPTSSSTGLRPSTCRQHPTPPIGGCISTAPRCAPAWEPALSSPLLKATSSNTHCKSISVYAYGPRQHRSGRRDRGFFRYCLARGREGPAAAHAYRALPVSVRRQWRRRRRRKWERGNQRHVLGFSPDGRRGGAGRGRGERGNRSHDQR